LAVSNSTFTTTCSARSPNTSATTCAHTVMWPWPAGAEAMVTFRPPSRSMADGGAGDGAVLRPGLGALLGRQHGADVAHVGHRGLDDGRHADAVQPPGRARLRLALAQPARSAASAMASHRHQAV
jgi:hypothetical protein